MMKKSTVLLILITFFSASFAVASGGGGEEKDKLSSKLDQLAEDAFAKEMRMVVYPNPTSGSINIKLDVEEEKVAQIEVFDLIGKKVMDLGSETFSKETSIGADIRNNPEGIYFVKVTFEDNSVVSRKVILKK